MSMMSRITRFARSPQGRQLMDRAKRYAKSPEGRRKLAETRARLGRGRGTSGR
jgi:hypothetical protein